MLSVCRLTKTARRPLWKQRKKGFTYIPLTRQPQLHTCDLQYLYSRLNLTYTVHHVQLLHPPCVLLFINHYPGEAEQKKSSHRTRSWVWKKNQKDSTSTTEGLSQQQWWTAVSTSITGSFTSLQIWNFLFSRRGVVLPAEGQQFQNSYQFL